MYRQPSGLRRTAVQAYNEGVTGTFNYWLVLLSVVVATLASFVMLELTAVVAPHRPRTRRGAWIALGAAAIGTGIWSMHFIGMLGFHLPTRLSYDVLLTIASLLIAIAASGAGLLLAHRGKHGAAWLVGAGTLIGIAIAGMHYTGMAALRMAPPLRYQPLLFSLSIAIAVAASILSLWSAHRMRLEGFTSAVWKKAGSAFVMGSAIYGMHYTGMAAAHFAPDCVSTAGPQQLDPVSLALILGAFTLAFLTATLLVSAYEAYLADSEFGKLSRRLMDLQDEERRTLAAELHDIVGQNLSALNTELALIGNELAAGAPRVLSRRLADATALVRRSVEAVRNVMTQLRPPGLDELGLAAAIRWHVQNFAARTGIAASVIADDALPRPQTAVADAVLRIHLEVLNNVAKHAGAAEVRIALQAREGEMVLAVSDNGRGFAADAPIRRDAKSGWGLMIMQERAAAAGGELRVDSAPGKGTRVELTIPWHRWS